MKDGFLRVAAVAPEMRVCDVDFNVKKIIVVMDKLEEEGVETAVFPELCITGYTCGDLFMDRTLLNSAAAGLEKIVEASRGRNVDVIVGVPVEISGALYNCAAFVHDGEKTLVAKTYLPTYSEFYERRWFAPAQPEMSCGIFESHGAKIGIEICEDLWATVPPSSRMALEGAQVIFNLSASDDVIGKNGYLMQLIAQQSGRCLSGYVYASAGFGESTTDVVYLPKTVIAENGSVIACNDRRNFLEHPVTIADIDIEAINHDRRHTSTFAECQRNEVGETVPVPLTVGDGSASDLKYRKVDAHPFVPSEDTILDERCIEIATIQECGLARRLKAVGSNRIVVGISGGLDSTLALLVAHRTVKALGGDVKDIIGVTMPGFGTTSRTYDNALKMMTLLGITIMEIPIGKAVMQHFSDIGQDPDKHDVTYENSQARERTQILMDLSNRLGGIVLGTGDLSELALGWATYNGDQMSMYGVNAGVPKTLVKYLVRWYAQTCENKELHDTLMSVVETPISPELTPPDEHGNIEQKTESFVGPYELSDFFLYYMLRYGFTPRRVYRLALKAFYGKYDGATILKWMKTFYRRFFTQQFKRSCMPDGPKVGSVSLSPRGDWRMPSDASSAVWLREVELLEREL